MADRLNLPRSIVVSGVWLYKTFELYNVLMTEYRKFTPANHV